LALPNLGRDRPDPGTNRHEIGTEARAVRAGADVRPPDLSRLDVPGARPLPRRSYRFVTVKLAALVADPLGVVTETAPDFVPPGTVAVTCVSLTTVNAAALPLNATDVVAPRFVPLIVTSVPTGPLVGVKPVMVGAAAGGDASTVNADADVAVPVPVVTAIGPLVAPAGTVALICDALSIVKLAVDPLKVTDDASAKFEPVIVTVVPAVPLAGEKPLIDGAVRAPVVQPGSVNDPIRVSQLSCASVVGSAS